MVELGKIIVIIGGIVSIALLIYFISFRRGKLEESESKWLLFIGLLILPLLTIYIAGNIALEESKSVATCNNCHTMKPYVKDMVENVNRTTLASVHYQNRFIPDNQCYTCHTNYGIYGDIEAKIGGAMHAYNYYTGNYGTTIKLKGTYQNSGCLNCHGEARVFQEKVVHSMIIEKLNSNAVSCIQCHAPVHPKSREGE